MPATLCKRNDDGCGLSLPEDIFFDVLARLPAKDLCRFRCVSKGWRALIVAAQKSRAGPLIVAMFGSEPAQELRLLDKDRNVLRVFDVRGRASLVPTSLDLIFVDTAELGAMIIDPASGRNFTVFGTTDPLWAPSSTMIMVNDYSFGRAAPSGDYKVLRLHRTSSSRYVHRKQWCEIATIMDSGAEPSWRRRPWGPLSQDNFVGQYKATVNGVLYFMSHGFHFASDDDRHSIAVFGLESEEWKQDTIKGPLLEPNVEGRWCIGLTELKGTLSIVRNARHLKNMGGHYVNIWILMDHSRGIWVKQYTIQMTESLLFTKPLDVLGDGTVLLLLNSIRKAPRHIHKYHTRYSLQLYNSEGFNGKMAFYTGSILS